ncbi:hypothetical protein GCM10009812_04820 [Nocardioides marinus]|uniref:Uncharacterized protein n=1 Tax=Nocardioides marinus TaxID=374514 RepID=A0A7Y9YB58_9ACTN|nr:hypothetical protein [Nocardioides marinus]NYI08998.1 hypothetical protein [Nocardioides marinus]
MSLLDELRDTYAQEGPAALRRMVGFDHERKAPVATGRIARPDEIQALRTSVEADMARWLAVEKISDSEKSAFDADLGRALHLALRIVPADAAHEGTWSFLTLVVFPDIAALRFPDLHEDRFIGSPRNALRRTWQRFDVLGDLSADSARSLGEDELVGLFERSALVRNRPLAVALARRVLSYDGPNRSQWARNLYKVATFQSGVRLLDALDATGIEAFVDGLGRSVTKDRMEV